MIDRAGAFEGIGHIVDRGGDADEVLREVLDTLHHGGIPFAAIHFVDAGQLVEGPFVGQRVAGRVTTITYRDERIGALELADDDEEFARRVAALISPYVLVGWDTRGESWSP